MKEAIIAGPRQDHCFSVSSSGGLGESLSTTSLTNEIIASIYSVATLSASAYTYSDKTRGEMHVHRGLFFEVISHMVV